MTRRLVDDSSNASNVLHSLLEEDELHRGNLLIVLVELLLKCLLKLFVLNNSPVSRIVTVNLVNEGSEDQGLAEDLRLIEIWEVLFHGRDESLRVLLVVFRHDESVLPDTVGFMTPKSYYL